MAFQRSALLLLLVLAHFAPLAIPSVNALQDRRAPPARRILDHSDMKARMIKKRAIPAAVVKRQGNDEDDPPASPTPSPSPSRTTTPAPSPSTSTNRNPLDDILDGIGDIIGGGGSPSTTSRPPTSTSTPPRTTTQTEEEEEEEESSTERSGRSTVVRTTVVTQTAPSSSTTNRAKDPNASFIPKPVLIALIITGCALAVGAAIWTVIRKWKFSPSRHFEDRLEPVTWEPTHGSGLPHDPTVAALARGTSSNGHRQHGSLGSSDDNHSRNMTHVDDRSVTMAPDFPPAHDFTAGPAGGGYMDMHRGPSPNPGYGHYETHNAYDAYDYNAGYGQHQRY